MGWFARASDQMAIRMPGSAPFHLHATFHAYPGEELPGPKEAPQVITGDGTYDELWLSPHKWHREVIFGGYHAVEVESDKGRKMQATSDYEPSRVLMLLNALLEPVPRLLTSREFGKVGIRGWRIQHVALDNHQLVRISHTGGTYADFTEAFFILPGGLLLSHDEDGLVTFWGDDVNFGGKAVARRITIQGLGRDLLTAQVEIQSPTGADPQSFDLAGGQADSGMTLGPLTSTRVRPAVPRDTPDWPGLDSYAGFVAGGVIDRHGRYREVELLLTIKVRDEGSLHDAMDNLRRSKWHPATIDGDPCEFRQILTAEKVAHGSQTAGP